MGMAEVHDNSPRKIGAVLLALFGIIALVRGVVQMRNTMHARFALSNALPATVKQQLIDSTDHLKLRDTDRDQLSDFDELQVYGTSPYLYDTYGYGMSDNEVVKRGLPLCPGAGKNCGGPVAETSIPAVSVTSSLVPSLQPSTDALAEFSHFDLSGILKDPAQIRQILLQSGKVTAEQLKAISDAQLISMAAELFSLSTSTKVTSTSR